MERKITSAPQGTSRARLMPRALVFGTVAVLCVAAPISASGQGTSSAARGDVVNKGNVGYELPDGVVGNVGYELPDGVVGTVGYELPDGVVAHKR